jgi:hypothetical protein
LHANLCSENLQARDYMDNVVIDGSTILKMDFKELGWEHVNFGPE